MLVKLQTRHKFLWSGWMLLLLIVLAASPLSYPVEALAQSPSLKFDTLSVALWPEFDRPETLVIYRAQLDGNTPLPAEVSFRLPGHIDSMHAVAYEQDDNLLSINPDSIRLANEGDDLLLTFSTPSPKIQFEYYDPAILTKQDQTRTLNYHFSTLYPIKTVTFEVQQPAQADGFLLMPEPDKTFIGNDGFRYSNIQVIDIAPGETYSLSATYQSNGVGVLIPDTGSQPLEQSEELTLLSNSLGNENTNYLGYSLIGAGVLLFAGAGGYWWLKQTKAEINPRPLSKTYKPRPVRQKKERATRRKAEERSATPIPTKQQVISQAASFCYQCGVALREDSNFCHNCGAKRR